MAGRDKICHEIMAATGCDYTAAMRERNLRWAKRELDAYLMQLRSLPQRGTSARCVSCLDEFGDRMHRCAREAKAS